MLGRRDRAASTYAAKEFHRDWHTVKELEKQYMQQLLDRAGKPAPTVISTCKVHTYRIVVSDLLPGKPIWFGGEDRSRMSMQQFYDALGQKRSARTRLAIMDMWKPFRNTTTQAALQAAILFDKFHIMRHLGEASDEVSKSEYASLQGKDRRFIKGQKYTVLSRRENLNRDGRQSLRTLLAAKKRLNTAYLLKKSFGQFWNYEREDRVQCFFENWRRALQ